MTYHLYNDHFQNFKSYQIPKAQLIIADIPYNIGKNAYGSNPSWYVGGDNKNGDKHNNSIENLALLPNQKIHAIVHFTKAEVDIESYKLKNHRNAVEQNGQLEMF